MIIGANNHRKEWSATERLLRLFAVGLPAYTNLTWKFELGLKKLSRLGTDAAVSRPTEMR